MQTIALFSLKGGVGKTASAVNLAYESARAGQRTLLVDLDPQGASSFYLRVRTGGDGKAKRLFTGKGDLEDRIKASDQDGLDLLPARRGLRNADIALEGMKKAEQRLALALKPLAKDYDAIYLDCPPHLGLLGENILNAADIVLVPVVPTWLSIRTLDQLEEHLAEHGVKGLKLHPFFTLVQSRNSVHKEAMAELRKQRNDVLPTVIPRSVDVERMGQHRQPVGCYAASSRGAKAFAKLHKDLEELARKRLDKKKQTEKEKLKASGKGKKKN
jgi:cellulose biosynthesis protein BcsQ